jgi:ubiquinol-cytochrome c reductase cytochrome b subunit/menaquinol-cytochrome c reductase cytochrome b/c subunit
VNGAEGGVVFVYASADAARSAFRDGALDQTSALGSNVVAIYVPFRGAPAGARRDLFRCAFGPKLTPVLKTPRPPRTGREVFADAGCLACHRLGTEGNDGPGPDLSNVGRQLSRQAIVGALASPAPPMPSFRFLPRAQFQALVDYLHQLRGGGGR